MSESGYQEIDLDNPSKPVSEEVSDIEIVEESEAPQAQEPVQDAKVSSVSSATSSEEDDPDEDDSSPDASPERKKLTRSQRLKNQRDLYAKQLAETQARLADAENRARRAQAEANEGASLGFDIYIKQLDTSMQALRRDFDAAYDAGDRDKIFEIQQQIASIITAKQQAEKDKQTISAQRPTQQRLQNDPPPARPQQAQPQTQPRRQPSPAAVEWYDRNKDWFGKDAVMTSGAKTVDQQMVADGYSPTDPDYFEELDRRLKREFPHKLGGKAAATAPRPTSNNPTIQNRSAPAPAPGKVRVTITQADRDSAYKMGISVEDYAREKAKVERAQNTASQYTEIL